MTRLRSHNYLVKYVSGEVETIEWTSQDMDRAVQAIINEKLAAQAPVANVITEDGRIFTITNPKKTNH